MTAQEVINWLEAIEEKYIHGGDDYFDEKRKIAICIAISALEKQIPKKPLDKSLEYDGEYGYCPCCKSILADYSDQKRCRDCGQAIDWRDAK
jgi:hypothetical protein